MNIQDRIEANLEAVTQTLKKLSKNKAETDDLI